MYSYNFIPGDAGENTCIGASWFRRPTSEKKNAAHFLYLRMIRIILLLLLPGASLAQSKFDNTIVINEYVSIERLKSALFDAGFILQGTDTAYLETNEVKQKKNEVYIKLKMKRTDSSMVIKGVMKINVAITIGGVTLPPEYEPIEFWKSKSSLPRVSFDLMDKFAKSLSSNLTYQKN